MKVFRLHIIPLVLAASIAGLLIFCFPINNSNSPKTVTVKYSAPDQNIYDDFDSTAEGISPFVSALAHKHSIMLLGSSELTSYSPFIPYQFFNDSTTYSLTAFGHAFYQSFSMYCNLLAFKNQIEGKKICILLSPGWFETKGTNTEAFLDFVRPEMLSNIVHQDNASHEETEPIGEYINRNAASFAGLSLPMEYLSEQHGGFRPLKMDILKRIKNNIPQYIFETKKRIEPLKTHPILDPHWNSNKIATQRLFKQNCTNNLGIKDELLAAVLNGKKELKKKSFKPILPIAQNQEFQDLKLLIGLLKKYKAKPIFVMQGLNPAGYDQLNRFDEIEQAISKILAEEKIPYLNLFTSQSEQYQVGILNDLMHMGDLGWNEVNRFIYQEFCHE